VLGRLFYFFSCCCLCFIFPFLFLGVAKAARPNFVVFQVDDMTRSLLHSQVMSPSGKKPLFPNIERYFLQEGTQFNDFVAASPLCSPSRASLLSGQYSHNNRVVGNGGDLGGSLGWQNSSASNNNVVTRLKEEGYTTAHFGKWLNNYGEQTETLIPPGWDIWVTDADDKSTRDFYGYRQRWTIPRLGIDRLEGPIGNVSYGSGKGLDNKKCRVHMSNRRSCNYHTDLMSRMAADEIRATDDPFYVQIDYHAPHGDHAPPVGPQVATRHLRLLDKVILPKRRANFNEYNTSDKAYLTQKNNGLLRQKNITFINRFIKHAMLSLKSVDDGIGYVARVLKKRGILQNTYMVFLSDNGFFFGEHRFITGKSVFYEESSKVPFLMRGPKVTAGSVNFYPASTIDFAPTVIDLAGARPLYADGESLVSSLSEPYAPENPLRVRLIEIVSPGEIENDLGWQDLLPEKPLLPDRPPGKPPNYKYRALQIGNYKYLLYDKGGEELYNLAADPFEMRSLHKLMFYKQRKDYMRDVLTSLRDCRGVACNATPKVDSVSRENTLAAYDLLP
jgi:N-acetylglucosamine-6-sulfatase